jgi:sugar lactone lactonase YvrE
MTLTRAVLGFLAPFLAGVVESQVPDTVRMRVRWEVVEGSHPVADSLGKLSGIAVDARGRVYVSDFEDARIWVFDSVGRSLVSFGRKGRGPGEFLSPTGLAVDAQGRLWVRDAEHVSRFVLDARSGALTAYDTRFRSPTFADWTSLLPTRFDSSGHYFFPSFASVNRTVRTGVYLRYSAEGRLVDSIVVPAIASAPSGTAWVRLGATGGRLLEGVNHVPFAPLPMWDVTTNGTLLIGDGVEDVFRELRSDGSVRMEFRRGGTPSRIPAAEKADSQRALRQRLAAIRAPDGDVIGVPDEVRALRLPDVYPSAMALYSATDGSVWVRRWVSNGHRQTVFDVFSRTGQLTRVVTLPRSISLLPAPVLTSTRVIAVGVDPETGAHVIYRFDAAR